MARYVLTELDAESELLHVLFSEARRRPDLVQDAVTTLVDRTCEEFAAWLAADWAVPADRARSVAAVALGSLVSHRLVKTLLPKEGTTRSVVMDDENFVAMWVDTFYRALR